MSLSRFPAVWLSLFLGLWQETFEWLSYAAFHGPSEIDFSFGGGGWGEMGVELGVNLVQLVILEIG